MCSPHIESGELCSTLCIGNIYQNYWEVCTGDVSIFPIYLFNDLFILLWTRRYLFYTLGDNPMLHYLFCCSNCSSLVIGSPFSSLPWSFDTVCVCMCVSVCLSISLFSGTTRCCRLILHNTCPSPIINHFLLLENVIRNPNLGTE